MQKNDDWCVAVFKCESTKVREVLVEFYNFIDGMVGVKNVHFTIRDRVKDDIVFSFRLLVEKDKKKMVRSKLKYKLNTLLSEDGFSIDPEETDPLAKYVAWNWKEAIKKRGLERFSLFYGFLSQLSKIAIEMAKQNYFESEERVEMAHVTAWILGCTEYGKLLVKEDVEIEIGYLDRIKNESFAHIKEKFTKQN